MKKTVLLVVLLCVAASTFAWNPFTYHREKYYLHDFGIAIGAFHPDPLEKDNEDFVLRMRMKYLMDESYHSSEDPSSLTISGYYLYHLSERLSIGATVGWNGMSHYEMDRYDFYQDENNKWKFDGQSHAKIRSRAFHFMPTVKYIWFNAPRINFYSKGGAGIYYRYLGFDYHKEGESIHAPEKDVLFAYQVTPFGLDIGDGPVRFFLELGYGASGVVKAGVCCKLHRKWRDDMKGK
jgi:hypothetical protein